MYKEPPDNTILQSVNAMPNKDVGAPVQSCPLTNLKCGGPYKMVDPEKKGERNASEAFVLEIVPATITEGDYIIVRSAGGCSCAGATVRREEKSVSINAPSRITAWEIGGDNFQLINVLGGTQPKSETVEVSCGRDQSGILAGEIHVYPSDKIQIKVESDEIFRKCPKVAKLFDDLMEALSKYTGERYNPEEGIKFDTVVGKVDIEKPKLSLGFEGIWKEREHGSADEWKAYYCWKLSLELGISVTLKVDVLAVGVACTGVGAPVLKFAKRVQEKIGQKDPIVLLSMEFKTSGDGECGYEEKPYGGIKIEGKGTLALMAGINIPHKIIATIDVQTAISGNATGKAFTSGAELKWELLKWEGAQGEVNIQLDSKFFTVSYEDFFDLLEEAGPLWEGTYTVGQG